MITGQNLTVFEKYRDAKGHAFVNGVVSEEDKDAYWLIYTELCGAFEKAISDANLSGLFELRKSRFARDGGVQGQRPRDLWAAAVNRNSKVVGRYPQVYVIASENGLEFGFSAAIHEDDYYNLNVKQRMRSVVPVLYRKFPEPSSEIVSAISRRLSEHSRGWKFSIKSREAIEQSFDSIESLVRYLRSPESSAKGGASIYFRVSAPQSDSAFNLVDTLSEVLEIFSPLMRVLSPTSQEAKLLSAQQTVDQEAQDIPEFDPQDEIDGRRKALRAVAVRQGQPRFREGLIKAYEGRCAVTECSVLATLQAAHIAPYNGSQTNSVQNGLLLRADIHNLFDLGLLQIEPNTYIIRISEDLTDTQYGPLQGKKIRLPSGRSRWPNDMALAGHRARFA